MAVLYITEHQMPAVVLAVKMPPLVSQTIAIGVSSAQSSAFNPQTAIVVLRADTSCSVDFGQNPVATSSSIRLAANSNEVFEVTAGHKVAVINNL